MESAGRAVFRRTQRRERVYLVGVLEAPPVPAKYYLSPKACLGMLRRAEEKRAALADKAQGGPRSAGFRFNAPPAAKGIGYVEEGLAHDDGRALPRRVLRNSGQPPWGARRGTGATGKASATQTRPACTRSLRPTGTPWRHPPEGALQTRCASPPRTPTRRSARSCAGASPQAQQRAGHGLPGRRPRRVRPERPRRAPPRRREGRHVGALAASPGAKQASHVLEELCVRRLTPLECERLQGFPDG